jgi:hypothetical protein
MYVATVDDGYSTFGQTSMASPVVTGIAGLLHQKCDDALGEPPLASMIKALLLHTTIDLGNIGPDYWHGWGAVDAESAVLLVDEHVASGGQRLMVVGLDDSSGPRTYTFDPGDTTEFKVTAVWTDPPGIAGGERALVNDIDIELIAPDGTTYLPWVTPYQISCLDALGCDEDAIPLHAVRAEVSPSVEITPDMRNQRDNIEQIHIVLETPSPGSWQLRLLPTELSSSAPCQVVSIVADVDMFPAGSGEVCTSENYCAIERCWDDCTITEHCSDSDPCTNDVCDVATGACTNTAIADCCLHDSDCDDDVVCTDDLCDPALNVCSNVLIPECCSDDSECDDGIVCTDDACDTSTGECLNRAIPGCCDDDTDCVDGLLCTLDTCDAATGECSNIPIPDCCDDDDDCDDSVVCTEDSCDTMMGECSNIPIPDCCDDDDDCDDGFPCTEDACDMTSGECSNLPIDGCCVGAECDDVDAGGSDAGDPDAGEIEAGVGDASNPDALVPDADGFDAADGDTDNSEAMSSGAESGGCTCRIEPSLPTSSSILVGLVAMFSLL